MTTGKSRDQLLADIERLRQELAVAEGELLDQSRQWQSGQCDSEQCDSEQCRSAEGYSTDCQSSQCRSAQSQSEQIRVPTTEEMLRLLPGLVVVFDMQLRRIVYINDVVERLLGCSAAEIIALGDRLMPQVLHGDDMPRVETFLFALADSDKWQTAEFRVQDREGRWHWLIARGCIIQRDGAGRAKLALASALEITQRKAAEESLRSSEERHRVLAETMLQGVVHQDACGTIISMNAAAERILGKSRERFLGSTSELEEKDTIREDGSIYPGQDHPSMVALRSGKPVRGEVMGVWNPITQMYRWIRIDAVPVLRPENPLPIEVYAVFEDITESKNHQEQLIAFHHKLSESYALLDTLSAKAPIGLAFVDRDFRFQRVNEMLAEIDGQPIAAHIGQSVADLFPHTWSVVQTYYQQALAGQPVVNVEVSNQNSRTGQQHHWLTSYYPVTVDDQIIGIGVVVVEVTSQKHIEQALKDADRHKDEFLATLAHELRNPLAPIRASIEVFKLRAIDDPDLVLSRDVIDRQVTHMARLLEDLLDVSRISRNTLELRRERVFLQDVFQMALETSQPIILSGRHRLTVNLPTTPVALQADSVRLAQVFSNLLNNAAKYTEPEGEIEVHGELDGDTVVLTVRDNGIGIAPEMQPRIFDIFSQANSALQRSQGGLGIGLSLVKGLVELHNATIDVSSAGLNQGSTFTVRLPIVGPSPAPESSSDCNQPALIKKSSCRILVADDMRDNADTLGLMLRVLGNEVSLAYGGEEAFRLAEQFRPHIALLDIGMPKVNGYETAERIRSQPWGADIILVALTGWAREEDRHRTKAAGFDHHLVKPVALASLVELIQQSS